MPLLVIAQTLAGTLSLAPRDGGTIKPAARLIGATSAVLAFVFVGGAASGAPSRGPGAADLAVRSVSSQGAGLRGFTTVKKRPARKRPRLQAIDGGAGYYGRFSNPLPTRPTYFPIGVWLECLNERNDIRLDKEVGLNVYVAICGTGQSALNLARAHGMRVINEFDWPFSPGPGAETAGYLLGDELDMTMGLAGCAEIKRRNRGLPADRRFRHANYGKGVLFWLSNAEAACFVNAQELVSTDTYWFTDNNVCGRSEGGGQRGVVKENNCHVAANYGWQVTRVRRLVSPASSKPVWAFVELGHPFSGDWPTITPPQIRAAVWHSLIAGARGVIYFNHSFGGACRSQHILREPMRCNFGEVRATVRAVNAQIKKLAPVLNAPFVTSRWAATRATRAMVKWHRGHFYVFAGSGGATAATGSFSIPCVGRAKATVIGERRAVPVKGGSFTDSFADGNTIHIYRIDGGSTCGLR